MGNFALAPKPMRIKLFIMALSLGTAALSLVNSILLGQREGASNSVAVFNQVFALAMMAVGFAGSGAGRNQMVHERLSKGAGGLKLVREMWSAMLVLRLAIVCLLMFMPLPWLRVVTGFDEAGLGEAELPVVRYFGLVCLSRLLLDGVVFVAICKHRMESAALTLFVAAVFENAALYFFDPPVPSMLIGTAIGEVAIALVYAAWTMRRGDLKYLAPVLSLRAVLSGLLHLLPMTIASAFLLVMFWARNYMLAGTAASVALFAYVQAILRNAGLSLSAPIVSTYGVWVSDAARSLDERRGLAMRGLGEVIGLSLGVMAIVYVMGPWALDALFGKGSRITPEQLGDLKTIMFWMAPLAGGTLLFSYALRVAQGFDKRARFITLNVVTLAVCLPVMWFFRETSHALYVFALGTGLAALAPGLLFFLTDRGLMSCAGKAGSTLGRGVAATCAAAATAALGHWGVEAMVPDPSRLVNIALAAAVGGASALVLAAVLWWRRDKPPSVVRPVSTDTPSGNPPQDA